jgi:hypothetical protein
MLFLDETTLFFYSHKASTTDAKTKGLIDNWANDVQAKYQGNLKIAAKQPGSKADRSAHSSTIIVSAMGKSRTTSSNSVATTSVLVPATTTTSSVKDFGGLDDEDESSKHEAAMSSPIKGGKRLTSMVLFSFPLSLHPGS